MIALSSILAASEDPKWTEVYGLGVAAIAVAASLSGSIWAALIQRRVDHPRIKWEVRVVARHDCDVAAPDEGKFRLMLKGREVTRSTLYDVALINVGKKDVRSNHFADEKPLRLVIQGRVLEALPPLHTSLPHSWEVGPMETILSIDPCHIRVKSLHIFSFISEGAVRWYAEDEVPLVDIKFENGSVPALKHPPEVVRFANSLFKSLTEPPRAVRALSSTSGNWLNVVERWFAELTRRVL